MNRIGVALLSLIALQWAVSRLVYMLIASKAGVPVLFFGSPRQFSHAMAQMEAAAAKNVLAMPLALFFATLVGNSVPFLLCARALRIKPRRVFAKPAVSGGTTALFGIVAIGAGFFLSMVVGIAAALLKSARLVLTMPSFQIPKHSPIGAVLMVLAVVILAPLTEEFICRGVLLRAFRRHGDFFAVVASSLVWALLHGNFVQGVPVFAMGIFLGLLALRANSIWPTFLIHVTNNALALAESVAQGSAKSALGLLNVAVLFAAMVLFAVFFTRFRLPKQVRTSHGFAVFFTCIPILLTFLLCSAMTVLSIKPL